MLVADDDVTLATEDINQLFSIRSALDLWVLQPANDPTAGKADYQEVV